MVLVGVPVVEVVLVEIVVVLVRVTVVLVEVVVVLKVVVEEEDNSRLEVALDVASFPSRLFVILANISLKLPNCGISPLSLGVLRSFLLSAF